MKTFFLIFCILSVAATFSQQELSLEQCREIALKNNKQMAVSTKNTEKSDLEVKANKANYLPKLSASGMYYLSTGESKIKTPGGYLPTYVPDANGNLVPNIVPGTENSPVFNQYAYMPETSMEISPNKTLIAGIQLEQPIYTGGKISAAYKMTRIGQEISKTSRELTRTQIIVETDKAFWTYIQARELRESALSYKEIITELLRNVENAYNNGMKQRNDVLKVQVRLNEAELQLRRAENAIRLTRMNLCQILGFPLDSELTISAKFPEVESDKNLRGNEMEKDISKRPEYQILNQQLELKEQEIRITRSDYLPNVGLTLGYNYINGIRLNGEKMVSGGDFSALLAVRIPIFEWGQGINKVKSARIEENMLELQKLDTQEKIRLEIAQSRNTLDESQLETELTFNSLQQAEENMRLSKNLYDEGMETLADYLEAQSVWQKANADNVNAKARLELNRTEYKKAIGELY